MSNQNIDNANINQDDSLDFEVLEANDASAIEEMGASSTISAGSTCSQTEKLA